MKLNFSKPFYLLLALPLFFASCAKQGPVGPAGPAGPQGTPGAAGATGTQGSQGNPGTANVIYSNWLDVAYTGSDSTGWTAEIPVPQLVDSILNNGEIKVYFNAGSDSAGSQAIFPLPIYDAFYFGIIINPLFTPQKITLVASGDASSVTDNGNHYFQYRYILIPGGTAAGRKPNGGVNWNNYAEVKKYLGLKD
jgi:hypothetical protein